MGWESIDFITVPFFQVDDKSDISRLGFKETMVFTMVPVNGES